MQTKRLMLSCSLLLAGCGDTGSGSWKLQQISKNGNYQATLACSTVPVTGPFQECSLQLHNATDLESLIIAVDGGMPAHGHGLPTAPQAVATGQPGEYRIEGLKYSMPGEWLLGFLLDNAGQQDKIVFRFTL